MLSMVYIIQPLQSFAFGTKVSDFFFRLCFSLKGMAPSLAFEVEYFSFLNWSRKKII